MIHWSNNQFLIEWKQSTSKQNSNFIIKYNHVKLGEEFSERVVRIEVLERVGFAAFVIFKDGGNGGKYWEKSAVSEVNYSE